MPTPVRPAYANLCALDYGPSGNMQINPSSALGLPLSRAKIMQMSRPQVQDPGRARTPTPLSEHPIIRRHVHASAHARASLAVSCSVRLRTVPSKPGQLGAKPGTPCASLIDGPTQRAPFLTLRQEWSISSRKRPRLFTPLALPPTPLAAQAQSLGVQPLPPSQNCGCQRR